MIESVAQAFEAMRTAYERFMGEAEAFTRETRKHRMTLPPTLGTNNTKHNNIHDARE